MTSIIHQIFADNKEKYLDSYKPNYDTIKVLNHIASCRTPELGAAVYDCVCGERVLVYHSCRDRHCPVCQGISNARWTDKQLLSSLPVKYFHVVFTLPDTVNTFARQYPKQLYDALFKAASSALLKLCADPKHMGATPGFTAVLHTWGQTMQFHPHLHVIITAGGLSTDGSRFVDNSDTGYLLPVKALSKLYKGVFIDALDKSTPLPYGLKSSLYQAEFHCHLEEPLDRVDNVVKYLARYANRVCISDSRITAYDKVRCTVSFSYSDNTDGGKQKTMTLTALEFMRRFLLHVLPKRFMKIRHYGILANRGKFDRIRRCRRMLNSADPCFTPSTSKSHLMLCSKCGCQFSLAGHLSLLDLKVLQLC